MLSRIVRQATIQVRRFSLKIGDKVSVKRRITVEDVKLFGDLTKDHNPIHSDPSEGIVHGAFLNGLVSGVIGTALPGYGTVVVQQFLKFPNPCQVGSEVTIDVKVTSVRKIIEVEFRVYKEDELEEDQVVLEGNAKLLAPFHRDSMKFRKEPNFYGHDYMTVLLCPLCSQPRFSNLESLRLSLIKAATQSISCPICNEILMGLDKLTIHLVGHALNQNPEKNGCMELNTSKGQVLSEKPEGYVCSRETNSLDLSSSEKPETGTVGADCYEHMKAQEEPKEKESSQCTVNIEDLNFLMTWDNSFRTDEPKDVETVTRPSLDGNEGKEVESTKEKEDSAELSEFMSDLLNRKLPVFNFAFTLDTPDKTKTEKPGSQESESKQVKCSSCDFTFQSSVILSMHEELVHSKPKEKKEEEVMGTANPAPDVHTDKPDSLPPPTVTNFVLPRYDCHLCSKSFKMKGSLLVHYKVAHIGACNPESLPLVEVSQGGDEERQYHCSICGKSFKKEQHLTQHVKTHEGKQWQCKTCNKHFTTKYFLKKHQRLHTGEMPYSCQTCNKTFTFQQSYHKHLLYHSDEKPHQCLQCGRSFKELSTLHNHERIHSGEKPFACETCGKCFRQRVSYIVHQRIHTGVLPYQCTACKKKFRYKVSQRSHKCTAQPPGVVIRQPGDLIQRILQCRNDALQCSQ